MSTVAKFRISLLIISHSLIMLLSFNKLRHRSFFEWELKVFVMDIRWWYCFVFYEFYLAFDSHTIIHPAEIKIPIFKKSRYKDLLFYRLLGESGSLRKNTLYINYPLILYMWSLFQHQPSFCFGLHQFPATFEMNSPGPFSPV